MDAADQKNGLDAPDENDELASFGFKDVDRSAKSGLVREVFDSVADRYDLMNDLMSAGVHRIWKSTLMDRLAPQPGRTVLDMAGGTGDIAQSYLRRAKERDSSNATVGARAIICDINHSMLTVGKGRTDQFRKDENDLSWICGDAEAIPLPDHSVDAYIISFGIRNVTNIDKALSEAFRLLKFGGRFFCLEFSEPIVGPLRTIYDTYSFNVIPPLGEAVTGDRESYQYLIESIRRFPKQKQFASMIEAAGFKRVAYENLSGGIAAIHTGAKV